MGSIGVRCSSDRTSLWFHLQVKFAEGKLHPDFRTDGIDKELNKLLRLRHPWDELTYVGSRITIRVLAIPGVRGLAAREDYFDLEVAAEELWPEILPKVVEIIRDETDDPQAEVVIRKNDSVILPQWHAALLSELFG